MYRLLNLNHIVILEQKGLAIKNVAYIFENQISRVHK